MSTLGVLLAAGTGTRFDGGNGADGERNKLLAELGGEPVVVRAGRPLMAATEVAVLDDLVVVLGHEADRVRARLAETSFDAVTNPDYRDGQATSVRCGARVARERDADAAVFALGDMPFVAPATVTAVVDALHASDAAIAVPEHDGKRGNPVAFGAVHFDDLVALDGNTGGRYLFAENRVEWVPVDDEGVHLDVDTTADLAALRGRSR